MSISMPSLPCWFDHPGPIAMAHRGFSLDGRENSMAAFAAAVDLDYRYVETDAHATSDGVVVAFHDDTLDRVTDHAGPVASQPWSVVSRARIGGCEPIPTIEELLGTWPQLRVNLDVKSGTAVVPLVRAIERTNAHERVCIASFSDSRRREVLRRLSEPVATSAGMGLTAAFRVAAALRVSPAARASLRGVHCIQVPVRHRGVAVVTQETVAQVHAAGRQVHVWTINDPDRMHRLLDLGVDGIITDRADLLRDVLIDRGQWYE